MDPNPEREQQEAETLAVVERFLQVWATQDVLQTIALMAETVVSIVVLDHEDHIPASGRKEGREKIAETLYANLAIWHVVRFDPGPLRIELDTATCQINFKYVHLEVQEPFESSMRMKAVVNDSLIQWIEFHHDGPRVASFMKLVEDRQKKKRGEGG